MTNQMTNTFRPFELRRVATSEEHRTARVMLRWMVTAACKDECPDNSRCGLKSRACNPEATGGGAHMSADAAALELNVHSRCNCVLL